MLAGRKQGSLVRHRVIEDDHVGKMPLGKSKLM